MSNLTISINIESWYLNLLAVLLFIMTIGKLVVNYYEIKIIKLKKGQSND